MPTFLGVVKMVAISVRGGRKKAKNWSSWAFNHASCIASRTLKIPSGMSSYGSEVPGHCFATAENFVCAFVGNKLLCKMMVKS